MRGTIKRSKNERLMDIVLFQWNVLTWRGLSSNEKFDKNDLKSCLKISSHQLVHRVQRGQIRVEHTPMLVHVESGVSFFARH